jgi:flagellar L-ring protein precursor FlgH
MNATRLLLAAALSGGLILSSGCASGPTRDPAYAAVRPVAASLGPDNPGAIYQPGRAVALFEDVRARHVGDILTIRLVESTSARKNASTTTKKENAVDIANPTLLGSTPQFNLPPKTPLASRRNNSLETSLDSKQKFTGEGDSSQGNSLSGSITVTVAEVLANGNLVVRGEKLLTLNQGHEFVRLAGIVRPADIGPDNSVLSTQVADAQISYGGEGVLDDANSKGWLARFFGSSWWPF